MTKTPEWLDFLRKEEEFSFVVQDETFQILDALECLLERIHDVELSLEEFRGMTKKQIRDCVSPEVLAQDRAWLRIAKKHFRAGIRELRKRYKDRWRFHMDDMNFEPIYSAVLKAPDHVFLNIVSHGL